MTSIDGMVVAITGATRGIGRSIAVELAERGARVALAGRDQAMLARVATEIGAAYFAPVDVTDPAAIGRFVAAVEERVGPIDVFINNAGVMPAGPLLEEDDQTTRLVFETDALGTLFGVKRALEVMVPRGHGHIINISSTMAEVAVPGLASYNAAKAAVCTFTDAARLEHRSSGVLMSAILPGGVNTELAAGMDTDISLPLPFGNRGIAVVRKIEPQDVAAAVIATIEGGRSRPRVYVPRTFGALLRAQRLLPRRWAEAAMRAVGAEQKALATDAEVRSSYEGRLRQAADD